MAEIWNKARHDESFQTFCEQAFGLLACWFIPSGISGTNWPGCWLHRLMTCSTNSAKGNSVSSQPTNGPTAKHTFSHLTSHYLLAVHCTSLLRCALLASVARFKKYVWPFKYSYTQHSLSLSLSLSLCLSLYMKDRAAAFIPFRSLYHHLENTSEKENMFPSGL